MRLEDSMITISWADYICWQIGSLLRFRMSSALIESIAPGTDGGIASLSEAIQTVKLAAEVPRVSLGRNIDPLNLKQFISLI